MIKRALDFCLSLSGLVLSIPLRILIGFLIWLQDRGPVFYFQDRVGKDSRIFKSVKFRSMKPAAEQGLGPVQAKEEDSRITPIGKILRKTAMDELPQLYNICKGDMSFVGPRALRPIEIDRDNTYAKIPIFDIPGYSKRSTVRPGLTGVAQVFASRNLSREEKFKYDLWYIDNMSFWVDIKLIAASLLITFKAKWDN